MLLIPIIVLREYFLGMHPKRRKNGLLYGRPSIYMSSILKAIGVFSLDGSVFM